MDASAATTLTLVYTDFMAVPVPFYPCKSGPKNVLHFCDVALPL